MMRMCAHSTTVRLCVFRMCVDMDKRHYDKVLLETCYLVFIEMRPVDRRIQDTDATQSTAGMHAHSSHVRMRNETTKAELNDERFSTL